MAKLTREKIREGLDQIPMETILTGTGKKRQLTSKQAKFVKGIVEGKPKAQAYRESYNTKAEKKRQGSDAVKLAQSPRIAQAIEEEMLVKKYKELRSATQMREEIIQALYIEAMDKENNPPSVRVNALTVLGKITEIGLFNETKTTNVIHHKASDIKAQLMERLKAIVDITPKRDDVDDGMSLLEELKGVGHDDPGSGDADTPTPRNGPLDDESYTHSIPHKQSQENSNLLTSAGNIEAQDVDFVEEKNASGNVTTSEGEGVDENLADRGDDFMEKAPVNDLKTNG